jgi:methyltransferase-like protein
LSPLDRHLLPLLDGTRDRDALVDALLAVHRLNPIPIERDGNPVSNESEMRDALTDYIDGLPRHLAQMKLLRLG